MCLVTLSSPFAARSAFFWQPAQHLKCWRSGASLQMVVVWSLLPPFLKLAAVETDRRHSRLSCWRERWALGSTEVSPVALIHPWGEWLILGVFQRVLDCHQTLGSDPKTLGLQDSRAHGWDLGQGTVLVPLIQPALLNLNPNATLCGKTIREENIF